MRHSTYQVVNLMFGCDFCRSSIFAAVIAGLISKFTSDNAALSGVNFAKVVRPTGPIPMSERISFSIFVDGNASQKVVHAD